MADSQTCVDRLLSCQCDYGRRRVLQRHADDGPCITALKDPDVDRCWGTMFRFAAIVLLLVFGFVNVIMPYRDMSYTPDQSSSAYTYTYQISPKCLPGTDPAVTTFIYRNVGNNPWWTTFGCVDDNTSSRGDYTPVYSMTVFVSFFAVAFVAVYLWAAYCSSVESPDHCRRCTYAWTATPFPKMILGLYISCVFLIVAYQWTEVNSDTEMCVPQIGEYNDFGDLINLRQMFTQQTVSSPVFNNASDFKYLRDVVIPQCPGVTLHTDIPDRWFSVRYEPNPELELYLRTTAKNVFDSATKMVTYSLWICLIGDPVLTFLLLLYTLDQIRCCCCCRLTYCTNLCNALCGKASDPPQPPKNQPAQPALPSAADAARAQATATPTPNEIGMYPVVPKLSTHTINIQPSAPNPNPNPKPDADPLFDF